MVFPKLLKEGDWVGLIAPSSPISVSDRFLCESCLKKMGYRVLVGECLKNNKNVYGYLAGDCESRAKEINEMFGEEKVKGIFCARGGYGSSQLLPHLDYEMIRQNPKVFVGYSDVTSIHAVLQKYGELITFHGPMVKTDLLMTKKGDYTQKSFQDAISIKNKYQFENPKGEEFSVLQSGEATGRLIGGNLSVLAKLAGTPYVPCTTKGILFLEEVGESIPKIDMYLNQMKYAGMFVGVKGILLGDFTQCNNEKYDDDLKIENFLKEWFLQFSIPVMGNIYSDHRKPMGTLPMGIWCKMNTYERKLIFYRLEE